MFFNACGSNDMEDTALKSKEYYEAHLDEAKAKAKWCFEKLDIPYPNSKSKNEVAMSFNKALNKLELYSKDFIEKENINMDKIRGIDIYNCYRASYVVGFDTVRHL
ncbi:hypothetical protein [Campylobacter cuniculorum]|uniref:Uncharacterized protein n=1 Tax=Campylobacter cuniculorum TaxID=374106 RepID=A0ABX6U2L8_9BACT|nr:hypothetical protein [Campylobacter cuniculorum]QOR04058.1 hypothetical protein A0071_07800 [Campylobacter cuniculorum]